MVRTTSAALPAGLYGMLLLALCWLLWPSPFQPLERLLLGAVCLPQRLLGGAPALAGGKGDAARLDGLAASLRGRAWQHDVVPARALLPPAMEPLLCRVLAVEKKGGGGMPCELRLDRSYAELAGCADLVTKGDALLGFLARPGVGKAAADRPEDRARVLLLNHPDSRPVAARLPLGGGGELRCVVEPAAVVDPAPLRTALHDDPYRAAGLAQSGGEVTTLALDAAWIGAVPAGLRLGRARVWGYERPGGDVLTIGVYVETIDPRALSHVVVWQTVPGAEAAERRPPQAAALLWPLQGGTGGRWLLAASAAVPDGAAVVQDGVCLGRARGIAFGQALCASLPASRQAWALLLLPDDAALGPQELWGEVAFADGATAWFKTAAAVPAGTAGFVFTGANGPHCPAGLLLGRAEQQADGNLLRIVTPMRSGALAAFVFVEGR